MANNDENQRLLDLTKIPTFSGNSSTDLFNAEQWVQRIDRSRLAGNWNDDQTMAFVLNALRLEALLWYDSCARSKISTTVWAEFKIGFLSAYSKTRTCRTATVNLADLNQGHIESVNTFYTRVIKAVNDLQALRNENYAIPANPWVPELAAIPELMAADVAHRAKGILYLVKFGATDQLDHLAQHLFVSNLRPAIRDQLLRTPPTSLIDAYNKAKDLESIFVNPAKPLALPLMAVAPPAATDADGNDLLDADMASLAEQGVAPASIEAIQRKFNQIRTGRPSQQQRPTYTSQQRSGNSQPNTGNSNNPFKDMICRYCNIKGHGQKDCRKRKRENGLRVDGNGTPYSQNRPAAATAAVAPQGGQVVYVNDPAYLQLPPGYPQGAPPSMSGFQ